MIKRLRQWLWERYLPTYCRDSWLLEHQRQLDQIAKRDEELRELKAYTRGLETSLRALRRIRVVIRNDEVT